MKEELTTIAMATLLLAKGNLNNILEIKSNDVDIDFIVKQYDTVIDILTDIKLILEKRD